MSLAPPPIAPGDVAKIINAIQQQSVATITSALIIASGRPHSIQQALDISRDIHFAMHPAPNMGAYKEWEKTKGTALNKVQGMS
jgi:hypothetical protein